MLRAWKKEVCAGSRPVGPLGIVQLHGAITPALAASGFTNSFSVSMTLSRSALVKMKPRLPFMTGMMAARAYLFRHSSRCAK